MNDKFALISELDRVCEVKVKTPVGYTKTFPIKETILQGSVFGPIKCSIQVDTFGRDLLSDPEGLGIFKYKGLIDIPPLSLIDNVICVSQCGIQSIECNAL